MIASSNILQLCMLEFSIIGLYVIWDCEWRFSMMERRTRLFIYLLNKFHHEFFFYEFYFPRIRYMKLPFDYGMHCKMDDIIWNRTNELWFVFLFLVFAPSLHFCVRAFSLSLLFGLHRKNKVSFCASLSFWYHQHHCHHHYRFVNILRKRACSQNIIIVCIAITFHHWHWEFVFVTDVVVFVFVVVFFSRELDEDSSTLFVNRFLLRTLSSCFHLRSGRLHSRLKFSRQLIIAYNCLIYRPKLKTLFELLLTTMIY